MSLNGKTTPESTGGQTAGNFQVGTKNDARNDDSRDAPVLRVSGLTTRFGTQTIHDDLDLTVRRGEILGVVGGSGAGKSVLLRTIVGLNRPRAGNIELFGEDMTAISESARRQVQRRFGVLFQDGALFSALSVAQNVMVPMREHLHMSETLMCDIAALKIAMVGLPADAGAKHPAELSGGMRKRAGLARALALDPELLFLDEPTAGLDPIGAAAFDQLVAALRDQLGLTVFMVTHDLDSLFTVCDRIAVLADHRVIAVAPVADLLQHPHPWIREYFHGPRSRAAQHTVT